MQAEERSSHSVAKILRRAFGFSAFIGFGLSLIVHLLSFIGLNIMTYVPRIWVLHLGIFVFNLPLVFSPFNWSGKKEGLRRYFAPMPRWARHVLHCFFAYAILNFVIFIVLSHDGSPDILDGKYVLRTDGLPENQHVIREISKEEYNLRSDRILRGFSGHWMLFYLVPAFYFWFPRMIREKPTNS